VAAIFECWPTGRPGTGTDPSDDRIVSVERYARGPLWPERCFSAVMHADETASSRQACWLRGRVVLLQVMRSRARARVSVCV